MCIFILVDCHIILYRYLIHIILYYVIFTHKLTYSVKRIFIFLVIERNKKTILVYDIMQFFILLLKSYLKIPP